MPMIEVIDSFLNSVLYTGFMPLIAIVALVLAIIIFVFSFKKSKLVKITSLCIIVPLILISYHIIPYVYTAKAVLSNYKEDVIKNYNFAIKTAIFPVHKGLLLLDYAASLNLYKEPLEAKLKYEKAYQYLKEYKPYLQWDIASLFYMNIGEYEKAFEISKYNNNYVRIAELCILQKDYENALKYANSAVNKRPSAWVLTQRAAIYKKLGNINLAKQDFNKALLYAKQRNINVEQLQYLYNNPESYYKERIKLALKNLRLN